ncbi:VWA domain-containing protein [Candidatus Marithrix sp. Canyon 246]|uniref:VWA domain-containing protein n=1 Tax=Candidatus Marithrix sp. Canyon 246 TaxID=1827136 RepID=UPI000849FEFD|nr:VWA domain-containing protein [Candidatus Marithrix sp. Canyon 246]
MKLNKIILGNNMNIKFVIAAVFVMFAGIFTAAHAVVNPPADIVFIIDESGSMQNDIDQVRINVNFIADQLELSLDSRYALVEFGGGSGPNPGLTTNLTDAAGLSTALATLVASGGYEPGVEATIFAHDNVSFRTGSAYGCYVLITDEDSDGGNLTTAVTKLQAQNALWLGIVNPPFGGNTATTYGSNPGSLSEATGGTIFKIIDFKASPQAVLNKLIPLCIRKEIVVTPKKAANPLGTSHTVTALVRDILLKIPIAGVTVTFKVISGPNKDDTATAVTDSNGEASFTYLGDNGAGTDIIQGSFTNAIQKVKTDIAEKVWDSTPPTCYILEHVSGPPTTYIDIFTQDNDSGLASINILQDDNATVTIPLFQYGTTDSVIVHADKDDESQSAQVLLEVKDRVGNSIHCDPILTLEVRESGKPVSNTFTAIPEVESKINIKNGNPGLKKLEIIVNGNKYNVTGLKDNEERFLDISEYMFEGNDNTITLTAKGKPGTSAAIIISD